MIQNIILVAGARPNFVKIAPVLRAIHIRNLFHPILVHTGQHYDEKMSLSFFRDFNIQEPDYHLGAGPGTHAQQTATIMVQFEEVCIKEQPDLVIVFGDVNSTIAAGLVAKKLGLELAHVEAGLRSGDRSMPEEINRLATDAISDIFFTTEEEANRNLLAEGHSIETIHFVGHVMIDTLLYEMSKLDNAPVSPLVSHLRSIAPNKYACLTLHRPANVDKKETLEPLVDALEQIGTQIPVLFPCHPRTYIQLEKYNLGKRFNTVSSSMSKLPPGIYLIEPLSYRDFLFLWKDATLLITDSGGLQEETTALGIPCITLRENTERPITVTAGSNEIAGSDPIKILALTQKALSGQWKKSRVPPLWDGKSSERILKVLEALAR